MKILISAVLINAASVHGIATASDDIPISKKQPATKGLFDGASSTSLGIGAAYVPRYEGSDQHRWRALPLIDIRRGRFFLGIGGMGVDLSANEGTQFGPRIGYRVGRKESYSTHRQGLGTIHSGAEAGLFLRKQIGAMFIRGNISSAVGNAAKGITAQLGSGYHMRIGTDNHLIVDASLNWADGNYTATYFGVTTQQALASGLNSYDAGAGIKSYGVGLNWTHSFAAGWFSNMGIRASRLVGDAADSPIVETKTQLMSTAAAGYRF
ncbi:MAG: MipA/OmpV family protein [Pseudomonadota bacterium]|nr:MipA/OmpV family protein [Pseudomonadota bacterium]